MSQRSAAPSAAPAGRRGASLLTLVGLVALGVGGVAAAGSPISPVRDWVVHVSAPSVAISLAQPDDAPAVYASGQPLALPFELRRAGDPPPAGDEVAWKASFVPADGSPRTSLAEGSVAAPTGAVVPVPLSVVIDADVPGDLVVATTTGASLQVRLTPADGSRATPLPAPAPPPTQEVLPGG